MVGVGGCWAQSVKEEVFERFPFVDVAFGPGQIHKLAEFLNSDSLTAQGYFEFEGFSGHLPTQREREFQAWVQISLGCNCMCSYCIVPSTRGREESRDPAELVAEAEALAADGVREVTLLGQNVNSYGRDLPGEPRIGFAELLARIDAVEGIERIRYTSPHPKDMREDVIRAHAELPALCEHIHLPLQSGSSAILKRMRRTYDRERYMERVAMIREHVPDCAITTDIIVGFPGETEADFEQTLEVVDEVGYDGAFTFIFSPRRETEAATMGEQVPHPVKRERMERLVELVQRRAPSARSASSGARWRCWSRARAAPTRRGCAAGRGTTRPSTSTGSREPGELARSRSTRATSTTLAAGCRSKPIPRCERLAIFGPTGVGKTAVAIALAELLRERGEDPVAISCDALQVYEGLERAHRGRHGRGAGAAGASAGRVRARHPAVLGRAITCGWRTRRSTRRWRRGGGRSWWGGPASTCARRVAELSLDEGRRPGAEDSELVVAGDAAADDALRPRHGARAALRADRRPGGGDGRRRAPRRRCGGAEALGPSRTARKALGFDELLARRRRADEEALAQLRPPPAHLDAQDPGRAPDRPHRPRRRRRRREIAAASTIEQLSPL